MVLDGAAGVGKVGSGRAAEVLTINKVFRLDRLWLRAGGRSIR
jgi:hypothetical protein